MSGLVCIQGDWSEVVWRWFGVVWWWFGANMAGLRNTNAFKFILQVFILSQKHILSVKKVVWCGLDVVWGDFEVVWGVLGWFGVFPRTVASSAFSEPKHRLNCFQNKSEKQSKSYYFGSEILPNGYTSDDWNSPDVTRVRHVFIAFFAI